MRIPYRAVPIVLAIFVLFGSNLSGLATACMAAEIRLLSSNAMNDIMRDVKPAFERATGHTLLMEFDSAAGVKRRIETGTKFDIAIVTPVMVVDLERQGKLIPGADIARGGYGVAIRAGATRHDISTTEAFRQTLLNAKSIIYNKDGQSGIYMTALIERLGIADQIRGKIILRTVAGPVAENIARGDAEIGVQSMSEIISVPGAELLGPLPPELQSFIVLKSGIATNTPAADAVQELIRFLGTAASAEVMRKGGMESLAH